MRTWPASRWNACSPCPDGDTDIAGALWATSERSRTICSALGLLLLVLPATSPAAQISVHATRDGDSFEVEATAQIDAEVADAWKVLTDYDRLAEFIPGMQESKMVSRDGLNVVVDQRGETSFLFFTFPMRVRLAIEEFPNDRIVSDAIAGNFKQLHGVYHLEARDTGMQLRYEGKFTPDFSYPPLMGTLVVRSTVERRFAAMVREIEKTRRSNSVPGAK